jgi:hypothetical protein
MVIRLGHLARSVAIQVRSGRVFSGHLLPFALGSRYAQQVF